MGRSSGSQNKISKTGTQTRASSTTSVIKEISLLGTQKPWVSGDHPRENSRLGSRVTTYLGDYQEAKSIWLDNLGEHKDAEAIWEATRGGYLKNSQIEMDDLALKIIEDASKRGVLIDGDGQEIFNANNLFLEDSSLDDPLDTPGAILEQAVLEGHQLNNLNCYGQRIGSEAESLEGLDASGANFSQGEIYWTSLSHADISGSNCQGTTFDGISMYGARAEGSDFSDSNFIQSNLSHSDFFQGDFSNSVIINCDLDGANLAESNFDGALLDNVQFSGTDLSNASFKGAVILNSDLRGIDLSIFKGADISSCLTD